MSEENLTMDDLYKLVNILKYVREGRCYKRDEAIDEKLEKKIVRMLNTDEKALKEIDKTFKKLRRLK